MVRRLSATFPERVNAVILGSAIEDPGAGEWPTEPMPDLLRCEGGLARVWAALGFTDPALVAARLPATDCEALACVAEGVSTPVELERYTVPVLSYKGAREAYFDDDVAVLRNSGAELHEVVDAHHYAAFAGADEVIAFVLPFLDKVHS